MEYAWAEVLCCDSVSSEEYGMLLLQSIEGKHIYVILFMRLLTLY